MNSRNNFAYIDGANLHKGILGLGWKLDYERFRVWPSEKYHIEKTYVFLGRLEQNAHVDLHLPILPHGDRVSWRHVMLDDNVFK